MIITDKQEYLNGPVKQVPNWPGREVSLAETVQWEREQSEMPSLWLEQQNRTKIWLDVPKRTYL